MNRIIHFEIHAKNLDELQKFYQDVFGWKIIDMGQQMGNYRLVMTDKENSTARGINGGMVPRKTDIPENGCAVNAFVCTVEVENIDETLEKIEKAGGTVALEKMDVPGVGILAYRKDPEGNIFGILQPMVKS